MIVIVIVIVAIPDMAVIVLVLMPVVVAVVVIVSVSVSAPARGGLAGPADVEAPAHVRAAPPPPELDPQAADAHGAHRRGHDGGRHAEIDERRDGHVAGDARGRLEVEVESRERRARAHVSRFRLSIAAI